MTNTSRPKAVGDKLTADEVNRDLPVLMTAGEAISATPYAVYIKSSDGLIYGADASFDDERISQFVGFVVEESGGSGSPVAVQSKGVVSGLSGLTAGQVYYISDTAGSISLDKGTKEQIAGFAITTTSLLIVNGISLYSATPQGIEGTKTFKGDVAFDGDIDFSAQIPTLPSATPTSGDEVTSKAYVDEAVVDGGRILFKEGTPITLTTTGTPLEFTVLANELGTKNGIEITIPVENFQVGKPSSGTNTCTFTLVYGTTTLATIVSQGIASGAGFGFLGYEGGMIKAYLFADGATNAQFGSLVYSSAGYGANTSSGFQGDSGTATEDSTGALILKVQMTIALASGDNTYEFEGASAIKLAG